MRTWAEMVQVMLVAPFQLIKYLVPSMKAQGWGRIIKHRLDSRPRRQPVQVRL